MLPFYDPVENCALNDITTGFAAMSTVDDIYPSLQSVSEKLSVPEGEISAEVGIAALISEGPSVGQKNQRSSGKIEPNRRRHYVAS